MNIHRFLIDQEHIFYYLSNIFIICFVVVVSIHIFFFYTKKPSNRDIILTWINKIIALLGKHVKQISHNMFQSVYNSKGSAFPPLTITVG